MCIMVGMFTLVEIKLQPRMQLECNYDFYPILFVIVSKFVNYMMKLVYESFSKGEVGT
jgi:hypothetical protein